jgi:large repetitive protein
MPTAGGGPNKVTISWGYGKSDTFNAPFTFTNPTNVTKNSVDVKDAFNGGDPKLLIGGQGITTSTDFEYKKTVDAVSGECTTYPNIATITSADGVSEKDDASVEVCKWAAEKTANPTFDRTFDWTLTKAVNKSSVTTAADKVTFSYTVVATKSAGVDSNYKVSGSISVDNPTSSAKDVVIVENIIGVNDETCVVEGAVDGVWTVPAGEKSFPYSCTLPTGGDGTNKVTVSLGHQEVAVATAPYSFEKPTTIINSSVDVKDDFNLGGDVLLPGGEGISKTTEFPYTREVDVPATGCTTYPNTARLYSAEKLIDSAEAAAKACRLSVWKSADPKFDRTFDWSITKAVDRSSVTTTDNSAIFTYTVEAMKSAAKDSNFTVSGDITIANPSEASETVTIADDILGRDDETCTVSGAGEGGTWTVPAGGASFTYTCWLPTKADGTNRVTVTWPQSEAAPATYNAPFTFGAPTKVTNNSADVTDAFNGAAAPGALLKDGNDITESKTFIYSTTLNVPTTGCTTYPNDAYVTPSDSLATKASASAEVCRQVPPVTPQPQANPAAQVLGTGVAPKAKLSVSKTGPRAATAGQIVTYTIRVKNTGKANATAVVLRDLLPNGYSLAKKIKGASFKAGSLSWKFGTLAPGKSKTVKASFRIDRTIGGRRCNVAAASAAGVAVVRDTACTRIAAVAGAVEPAVTG